MELTEKKYKYCALKLINLNVFENSRCSLKMFMKEIEISNVFSMDFFWNLELHIKAVNDGDWNYECDYCVWSFNL